MGTVRIRSGFTGMNDSAKASLEESLADVGARLSGFRVDEDRICLDVEVEADDRDTANALALAAVNAWATGPGAAWEVTGSPQWLSSREDASA